MRVFFASNISVQETWNVRRKCFQSRISAYQMDLRRKFSSLDTASRDKECQTQVGSVKDFSISDGFTADI